MSHFRSIYVIQKNSIPFCKFTKNTSGLDDEITNGQECAIFNKILVIFLISKCSGVGIFKTTFVIVSESDQLINCSVMNILFGTIISFLFQLVIVVA
nr:hypothetical protein [Candidatus Westeberhardia cardiocondylae]